MEDKLVASTLGSLASTQPPGRDERHLSQSFVLHGPELLYYCGTETARRTLWNVLLMIPALFRGYELSSHNSDAVRCWDEQREVTRPDRVNGRAINGTVHELDSTMSMGGRGYGIVLKVLWWPHS